MSQKREKWIFGRFSKMFEKYDKNLKKRRFRAFATRAKNENIHFSNFTFCKKTKNLFSNENSKNGIFSF